MTEMLKKFLSFMNLTVSMMVHISSIKQSMLLTLLLQSVGRPLIISQLVTQAVSSYSVNMAEGLLVNDCQGLA